MKQKLEGYIIKGIFRQKGNWYAQMHNDKDELLISATLDYIVDRIKDRYLPIKEEAEND